MLVKPLEIRTGSVGELRELFDDLYTRHLGKLLGNTDIANVDVSGMSGDSLTLGNKINEILALLRSIGILED